MSPRRRERTSLQAPRTRFVHQAGTRHDHRRIPGKRPQEVLILSAAEQEKKRAMLASFQSRQALLSRLGAPGACPRCSPPISSVRHMREYSSSTSAGISGSRATSGEAGRAPPSGTLIRPGRNPDARSRPRLSSMETELHCRPIRHPPKAVSGGPAGSCCGNSKGYAARWVAPQTFHPLPNV